MYFWGWYTIFKIRKETAARHGEKPLSYPVTTPPIMSSPDQSIPGAFVADAPMGISRNSRLKKNSPWRMEHY